MSDKKMIAGKRCPKCGWHITPMNAKFHAGVFGTEDLSPVTYTNWLKVPCTEPEPNTEYLAKYKFNYETEEWE